nr:ribonuclease H-like domain-containing protein [Tanacetum cinerariifolium]
MSVHGYTDDEYVAPFEPESVTLISRLNLGDPLYLHPNDSATLTIVYVKLKGTENYQIWFCAMMLALKGKNKTRFIDGSCRRSNVNEVLGRQWDGVNAIALGWILNSISEELFLEDFKRHNQLMKLMQFLIGLDNSYMQIISSILSRDPLPNVRGAYVIIASEESHIVVSSSNSRTLQRSQSSVFNSAVGNFRGNAKRYQTSSNTSRPSNVTRPPGNVNRRTNGGPQLVCEIWGFNGHTGDRCFKLIGYPTDFGKRNNNNNQGVQNFNRKFTSNNSVGSSQTFTFSDDQLYKIISLINDNSLNSNGKGVQANMAADVIVDSVSHPNGIEAIITKVGNMILNKNLTLHDVLVVPGYCVSLMYVHKVVRDSGLIVAFNENNYFVLPQDLKGMLLSPVLNGKPPFDLVFNMKPVLKHLRVFGCLCFATVLNGHDKFSSRAEKCVHVGYASFKKGYKLFSLERKQFVYSRDVKFFEKVFPFKIKQFTDTNLNSQGLDHVNFFNEIMHENLDTSNDVTSIPASSQSDGSHHPLHSSSTIDPSENDLGHSQGFNGSIFEDEDVATSAEHNAVPEGDNVDYESVLTTTLPPVRRSERTSNLLSKYNAFIVESKVKYGLENFVSYVNLNSQNKCFSTELNKSFEPKTFYEASKDQHWIEAMNNEMDALYRNNTWEITDLPIGRKAIGGYFNPGDNRVCRLKKSLYGLKQAPRQWNAKLTQTLVEHGFNQSKSDYSLFTKSMNEKFIALLVYVDDIIITGNNSSEIEKLKAFLNTKKYCLDLLTEFDLLACKPSAAPLEQNLSMTNEPTVLDPVLDNATEYQKLIGKLIYLTHNRPDISYSVHCLSQFMHKPLKSHLKIALKVLRYLKGCPGKGIHVVKQPKPSLEAYVDADLAKCIVTRKSDLNWEHMLPVNLFCDSQAAIRIAANPVFHERTKHLEIDLHFVREKILSGVLKIQKINTADQTADIFTKGLDRLQHERLHLGKGEGLLLPSVDSWLGEYSVKLFDLINEVDQIERRKLWALYSSLYSVVHANTVTSALGAIRGTPTPRITPKRMSAMANTTPLMTTVTKPATNPKDADATPGLTSRNSVKNIMRTSYQNSTCFRRHWLPFY